MTIDARRVVDDPKISYRTEAGWLDALSGEFTPFEWPTATNVGIAAIDGWEPSFVVDDVVYYEILEPDAVIEDFRFENCVVLVEAPRVTLRRCEMINSGVFNEYHSTHQNGAVYEDCTITSDPPGKWFPNAYNTAVGFAGFTMRRCAIIDTNEGVHTGGSSTPLADPTHPLGYGVRLFDCYTRICGPTNPVTGIACMDPDGVTVTDYHGDCCQAEDGFEGGVPLTIRNCAWYSNDLNLPGSEHEEFPCGACAIFYLRGVPEMTDHPAWWDPTKYGLQSMPPDVERLIVSGAGYSLHIDCGGRYKEMLVENVGYNLPITVEGTQGWPMIDPAEWECWMVDIDPVTGQPTTKTARIPWGYPGFGPMDPP